MSLSCKLFPLRLRTVKEFKDVFDSSADEKLVELLSTVESQHCFLICQAFVSSKKIQGEYE